MLALGHVADLRRRAIVRALAPRPCEPKSWRPGYPRWRTRCCSGGSLSSRRSGLLHVEGHGHNVSYTLSRAIRELATILLRGALRVIRATTEDRSLTRICGTVCTSLRARRDPHGPHRHPAGARRIPGIEDVYSAPPPAGSPRWPCPRRRTASDRGASTSNGATCSSEAPRSDPDRRRPGS